mgnify:CR=1 FL=1
MQWIVTLVDLAQFQSTLSMRRAMYCATHTPQCSRTFQSTLSMTESDQSQRLVRTPRPISIHALHEESDRKSGGEVRQRMQISIHALHEESDSLREFRIKSH